MDFDLNDDQTMLAETASRFLRSEYTAERRMKAIRSQAGHDPEIWSRFAEFGWLGLPISEEAGGLGGGAVDMMVLMEAFGEALVAEPYLGSVVLAARLLDSAASRKQRMAILPGVAEGKATLAFAFAEPDSRFELDMVRTTAEKAGDGFVLNGRKTMALNGAAADHLIVLARTGGEAKSRSGLSLFLLDGRSGVRVSGYRNVDGMRAADLVLAGVRVGPDALVGEPGKAFPHVEEAVAFATLAVSASAVGAMAAANRITIEYLKTRKQFGVAIGTFQALQHRVVDMVMAHELARSLVIVAAIKMQEKSTDRLRFVSAAKYQCGKSGRFIGKNAVQLHGGIGVSQEYVIGHYLKLLAASDILFGDSTFHGQAAAEFGSQISSERSRAGSAYA